MSVLKFSNEGLPVAKVSFESFQRELKTKYFRDSFILDSRKLNGISIGGVTEGGSNKDLEVANLIYPLTVGKAPKLKGDTYLFKLDSDNRPMDLNSREIGTLVGIMAKVSTTGGEEQELEVQKGIIMLDSTEKQIKLMDSVGNGSLVNFMRKYVGHRDYIIPREEWEKAGVPFVLVCKKEVFPHLVDFKYNPIQSSITPNQPVYGEVAIAKLNENVLEYLKREEIDLMLSYLANFMKGVS